MPERIYLDHAATTPMRPEAVAAVAEGMARWSNPSSPHAEGRAARAALEDARGRIGKALGWTGEVILTSGASESLAIALGRAKGGKRLVSAVEHDAVFRAAPDARILGVSADTGLVEIPALSEIDRPVLAVQHINSETGAIQEIDAVARLVREAGGILICDGAQSAGRFELPDADMIVVSAHKLGGPPGIGALLVRDLSQLEATGGQERGYRGGTENLPGALGFAAALSVAPVVLSREVSDATMALEAAVVAAGGTLVKAGATSSPWITACAMPGVSANAQLVRFDLAGFAVSAGSACSSGSLKRSRALAAFGVPTDVADRTIRISFGWSTTAEEIDRFHEGWLTVTTSARA